MNGKGRILRDKMANSGLVHIMAAHSPLSARLAEEAGFDGIWASGFELSALYGLADVSLISMTQHLDMMRAMAEQMDLPIVADIDTGFGNAINVIYAVQQYERAGASAVVIEDKSFPKVTSLVADGRQDLLRIEEFQGKIEAACRTRKDPDFLVIARDEALIAGLGQDEALKRAAAYEEAGADMILIHSKQKTPDEVESFVRAWKGKVADRHRSDRLSRDDRGAHPRARKDQDGDLRQPCRPRRRHGDERSVRRDSAGWRYPERQQEHRLGRGNLPPPGHGQGQGRRKAVPEMSEERQQGDQ